MGVRILTIFIFTLLFLQMEAQQPVADFNLTPSACLNQNIYFQNTSANSTRFQWDFCQGDLALTPTATAVKYLGGNITLGIDIVFDGASWFGFVVNRNSNSILRLEFGTDLFSVPIVTDLGNIGNIISNPSDIKLISENGNWFAFVYGSGSPAIVRVDFGNSLLNTTSSSAPITATVVVNDPGSSNGGFDMIYDGSNWIIVFLQNSSFNIVRLNSITSIPSVSDFISTINDPFGFGLADITLRKSNGKFYGYVVAFGNQSLQRLSFGSIMFSTPVIDDITSFLPSTANRPGGIDGAVDNGNFYLFISTLEGIQYKINLGQDLDQTPVNGISLGSLSILTNTLKLRVINDDSQWFYFSTDFSTAQLFRINFPNPATCPANFKTSSSVNPIVEYNTSGTQYVTLNSYNGGSASQISKSIVVNNVAAPDIDFIDDGICLNNTTDFVTTNFSGNINSYDWDFGDMTTSSVTSSNASHVYSAVGDFRVELTANASNGCQNSVQKLITIHNQPIADFLLPSSPITCTNQNYPFTNTSTFDPGSTPTFQWNIDANPVSTAQDLVDSFADTNSHSVQLVASIPGCSSQATQTFSVQQQGPLTNFSFLGNCYTDQTQFTNLTIGAVSGYSWDFGDGNISSQINPAETYPTPGTYTITLQANNASGCQNTSIQTITIYSKPQADFTIDLPPFSCSGSPSQFRDATPTPTDSNLASWLWDFADPSSGQNLSLQKNPLHTYANAGPYNVKLTVTTNNNCSATIQKAVAISQSPIASFTNSAACKDQSTNFTGTTDNSKSWNWQIGGTFYNNVLNPVHIFTSPGNYTVSLNVTGNNNCVSFLSRVITVPAPLSPDFLFAKNCTDQSTTFTDQTIALVDTIVKRDWDFAGVGAASGSPAGFSFSTIGNYGVKLKVTAHSGCAYTVAKNVNITASPTALFTATPESGVPPLLVKFNNMSTLATDYVWTFHDKSNSTTTVTSPSYTFQDFGDYVVDLTAFNPQGCSNTFSKVISALLPLNDIAVTAFNTTKNADGSLNAIATLKNNGNVTLNNATISMDLSGSATIRENINASIAPNKTYNHLFSYAITNVKLLAYVCAEAEVDNDVNPDNNRLCASLEEQLFLYDPYPNPARTELHLDFIANGEQVLVATITDALGKQVVNVTFQGDAGLNRFVIPTDNLPPGIYIVTIQTSSEKKIRQIAVSR